MTTPMIRPGSTLPFASAAGPADHAPQRLDAHNTTTDEDAAAHHQCGMQHLATGRVCHLPERHCGGCDFH